MPAPVLELVARANVFSFANPVVTSAGGTTVAGRTLCLCVWSFDSFPTSVTCGTDSLTMVDSFIFGGRHFSVWEKLNIDGGGTTYTINFAASEFVGPVVRAEISGVGSAGPSLAASGTGISVDEAFTTTIAEGVAVALVRDQSDTATSFTADSGYVADPGGGGAVRENQLLYSSDLGAAGPESIGGEWNASMPWGLIGRVYYPPGGGGSPAGYMANDLYF